MQENETVIKQIELLHEITDQCFQILVQLKDRIKDLEVKVDNLERNMR